MNADNETTPVRTPEREYLADLPMPAAPVAEERPPVSNDPSDFSWGE